MIKLAAKSLDELPEAIRGICKEENGAISLDETVIRTKADVDALTEAKRKEVNDKAVLAAWRKLGETPESVLEKLNNLESRAGNDTELTEKLAAAQREKRQTDTKFNDLKRLYDDMEPKFSAMKKQIHQTKTFEVLEKSVSPLAKKGVDVSRLMRILKKDVALGILDLDESEEAIAVKTGENFEEYAMTVADDFKTFVPNTPGGSNPGADKIPRNIPNQKNIPGEYYVFPDDGLLYGFGLAGERFGSAHSPCACGGRFCLVRVFSVPFFQLFFTVFTAFPFQFGVVFSGGVHAFGVQSSNIQDDLFMNKFRNITIAKWACTVRSFHNRFFWV